MPKRLSKDMIVLADGTPGSETALRVASDHAEDVTVLALQSAVGDDVPGEDAITVTPRSATVQAMLKLAAERKVPWVAFRRDLLAADELLSDLILATGKHSSDEIPGFAALLTPDEYPEVSRVLAVVDERDGSASGMLLYAAVTAASVRDASLHVLVLGAPGAEVIDPRQASDTGQPHEALLVDRDKEFIRGGLNRASEDGVEVTWEFVDSPLDRAAFVLERIADGSFDMVVDDLGDVAITGIFKRQEQLLEAVGVSGEIPLTVLSNTDLPLLLVVDAVRIGVMPNEVRTRGAVAAAALGLASTGALVGGTAAAEETGDMSLPMSPVAMQEALQDALGEQKASKGAGATSTSAGGAASTTLPPGTPQPMAKTAPTARTEKPSRGKEAPKVPARPKPQHIQAAKDKYAQTKVVYEKAKTNYAGASAAANAAQAEVDAAVAKAEAVSGTLSQAQSDLGVAKDELREATGFSVFGLGPRSEDKEAAEESVAQAEADLDEAMVLAAEALTTVEAASETLTEAQEIKAGAREAVFTHRDNVLEAHETYTAMVKQAKSVRVTPVAPGRYKLTARFGQVGPRWSTTHTGLDFAAPIGTPLLSSMSGKVVEVGFAGPYGGRVVVDHGNGLKTTYNHLSSFDVRVGQQVTAGQKVGGMGSTGNSTGSHLHFEVVKNGKFIDPEPWLFG